MLIIYNLLFSIADVYDCLLFSIAHMVSWLIGLSELFYQSIRYFDILQQLEQYGLMQLYLNLDFYHEYQAFPNVF